MKRKTYIESCSPILYPSTIIKQGDLEPAWIEHPEIEMYFLIIGWISITILWGLLFGIIKFH